MSMRLCSYMNVLKLKIKLFVCDFTLFRFFFFYINHSFDEQVSRKTNQTKEIKY